MRKFLIGLVIISAVIIRLYGLGDKGLWIDEMYFYLFTNNEKFFDDFLHMYVDVHPPIYYLFLYSWVKLFGNSEFLLRLPSFVFGLGSIAAVYLLCVKHFNRHIALNAAILISFSPFLLYYSQEARSYSLFMLFSIIATSTWIEAIQSNRFSKYTLWALLTIFTHYFGLILVFFQVLYLIMLSMHRKQGVQNAVKLFINIFFVSGVYIVSQYFITLKNFDLFNPSLSPVTLEHPVVELLGHISYENFFFIAVIAVFLAFNFKKIRYSQPLVYLSYIVLMPILACLAINEMSYLLHPRHVIFVLPLTFILISFLIDQIAQKKLVAGFAVFFLCSGFFWSYIWQTNYYNTPKQEWRESTAYLLEELDERSVVVIDRVKDWYGYYFDKNGYDINKMPNIVEDKEITDDKTIDEKLKNYLAEYDKVYIYSTTMLAVESKNKIVRSAMAKQCRGVDRKNFKNIIFYVCE